MAVPDKDSEIPSVNILSQINIEGIVSRLMLSRADIYHKFFKIYDVSLYLSEEWASVTIKGVEKGVI